MLCHRKILVKIDNIQHITYIVLMIRTQIYIPDDLYHQAKLMAGLDGVSISEYVREGLWLKIKSGNQKRKKKKSKGSPLAKMVGKYSVGKNIVTDVARKHNEIYDL